MFASLRTLLLLVLTTTMVVGPVVAKATPGMTPRARLAKVRRLFCDSANFRITTDDAAFAPDWQAAEQMPDTAVVDRKAVVATVSDLAQRCFQALLNGWNTLAHRATANLSAANRFSSGCSPLRC